MLDNKNIETAIIQLLSQPDNSYIKEQINSLWMKPKKQDIHHHYLKLLAIYRQYQRNKALPPVIKAIADNKALLEFLKSSNFAPEKHENFSNTWKNNLSLEPKIKEEITKHNTSSSKNKITLGDENKNIEEKKAPEKKIKEIKELFNNALKEYAENNIQWETAYNKYCDTTWQAFIESPQFKKFIENIKSTGQASTIITLYDQYKSNSSDNNDCTNIIKELGSTSDSTGLTIRLMNNNHKISEHQPPRLYGEYKARIENFIKAVQVPKNMHPQFLVLAKYYDALSRLKMLRGVVESLNIKDTSDSYQLILNSTEKTLLTQHDKYVFGKADNLNDFNKNINACNRILLELEQNTLAPKIKIMENKKIKEEIITKQSTLLDKTAKTIGIKILPYDFVNMARKLQLIKTKKQEKSLVKKILHIDAIQPKITDLYSEKINDQFDSIHMTKGTTSHNKIIGEDPGYTNITYSRPNGNTLCIAGAPALFAHTSAKKSGDLATFNKHGLKNSGKYIKDIEQKYERFIASTVKSFNPRFNKNEDSMLFHLYFTNIGSLTEKSSWAPSYVDEINNRQDTIADLTLKASYNHNKQANRIVIAPIFIGINGFDNSGGLSTPFAKENRVLREGFMTMMAQRNLTSNPMLLKTTIGKSITTAANLFDKHYKESLNETTSRFIESKACLTYQNNKEHPANRQAIFNKKNITEFKKTTHSPTDLASLALYKLNVTGLINNPELGLLAQSINLLISGHLSGTQLDMVIANCKSDFDRGPFGKAMGLALTEMLDNEAALPKENKTITHQLYEFLESRNYTDQNTKALAINHSIVKFLSKKGLNAPIASDLTIKAGSSFSKAEVKEKSSKHGIIWKIFLALTTPFRYLGLMSKHYTSDNYEHIPNTNKLLPQEFSNDPSTRSKAQPHKLKKKIAPEDLIKKSSKQRKAWRKQHVNDQICDDPHKQTLKIEKSLKNHTQEHPAHHEKNNIDRKALYNAIKENADELYERLDHNRSNENYIRRPDDSINKEINENFDDMSNKELKAFKQQLRPLKNNGERNETGLTTSALEKVEENDNTSSSISSEHLSKP